MVTALNHIDLERPPFTDLGRPTVIPIGEHRTRLTLQARFDTRGLLGRLTRWAILIQVGRTSRHLAEDLRHHIEHGTPSPRKQRQLRRARP